MIKLSRLADYGVVILAEMARSPGALCTASAMAEATGLPEPTVSKVLKLLCSGGVLSSTRGVNGGYSLKFSAQQTTVLSIITALDGPIALTACVNGHEAPCSARRSCALSGCWDMVNNAIHTALETLTLADMLEHSRRAVAERMEKGL